MKIVQFELKLVRPCTNSLSVETPLHPLLHVLNSYKMSTRVVIAEQRHIEGPLLA